MDSSQEINFTLSAADQNGIALQNAIGYEKITKLVKELKQQEHFLQNLMISLNAHSFVLYTQNQTIMVNQTFLQNYNLAESEVIGRPCHQIIRIFDPADALFEPVKSEKQTIVRNLKIVSELTKKMTCITRYEAKTYSGNHKIVDNQKAIDEPRGKKSTNR